MSDEEMETSATADDTEEQMDADSVADNDTEEDPEEDNAAEEDDLPGTSGKNERANIL